MWCVLLVRPRTRRHDRVPRPKERQGYFVGFGAYDESVHSNAKLLEERLGWNHAEARHATEMASVSVPAIALGDLLDEHSAPDVTDFMSVDTKGTEVRILCAFDFSRHRPQLIAVDHNECSDEHDLDALIAANGYERRFPAMSDWDGWYRSRL